jgi:mono/diheme cytochrome c family protein
MSMAARRVAVFALAALLAACGRQAAPPTPAPAGQAAGVRMPVPPMIADSPQAREAGHTLFVKMNCAGCHTYTGKGWMGPDLTDSYWRFGGAPEDIYRSIYEGRPQGMPAWGKALAPDEIWQLVLYIRALPAKPGGDPGTVSPVTETAISVDSLPPTPDSGASK